MNTLFVAYHAASTPIMDSQGISYMRGLAQKDAKYSLLTFEPKEELARSIKFISELDMPVKWKYLIYHKNPRLLVTCYDIVLGILTVALIIKKDKIKIVHARGFIAALIVFLPVKMFRIKILFDTRGLLADKYVCGRLLNKQSLTYKLMKWGEDILIKKSDYLTVETYRHAELIKQSRNDISSKMSVIPCCVDTNRFNYRLFAERVDSGFKLVFIGKVETWYLLEEMLDFFVAMSQEITESRFIFITESEAAHIYSVARKKAIDGSKIRIMKVDRRDVPVLLSGANAGIFFMNRYNQYSFSPIKFGEFLACGLPVIINEGFGDCDKIVLKENVGAVINEFSAKEYEKAIQKLKNLLSEGSALRQRCRMVAERNFSLEMGVERYWEIYRRLGEECAENLR